MIKTVIKIIDFKVVVEKYDSHELYTPKILTFSTTKDYPLSSAKSANITVVSSNDSYSPEIMTHTEFYDIVKLQVSIRYNTREKHVWTTVFDGVIYNVKKEFGTTNHITLECKGHIEEAYKAMILTTATYTNQDAGAIITSVCSSPQSHLKRLSCSAGDMVSGLTISQYDVATCQLYVSDVLKEMERNSGYTRMIDTKTFYYPNGNFQTCKIYWKPLSTTKTHRYQVIEGSSRLISASLQIVGEDVLTWRYIRGATESNTQYNGGYNDSAAIAKYGERYKVETFSWIKSNQGCVDLSSALVSDSKLPYIAISVTLEGTPDPNPGDLCYVKFRSLDSKGIKIDGLYTVYRVTQDFSGSDYTTKIELGRAIKNEYDYLYKNIIQTLQTAYKNQIVVG